MQMYASSGCSARQKRQVEAVTPASSVLDWAYGAPGASRATQTAAHSSSIRHLIRGAFAFDLHMAIPFDRATQSRAATALFQASDPA